MVQREVADRFFAAPRTKAYGAVSVLVQLVVRADGFHPGVARRSSGRRRTSTRRSSRSGASRCRTTSPRVKRVVDARVRPPAKDARRTRSQLAGLASRDSGAAALAAIGREPTLRAEALEPPEFVALAEALG